MKLGKNIAHKIVMQTKLPISSGLWEKIWNQTWGPIFGETWLQFFLSILANAKPK